MFPLRSACRWLRAKLTPPKPGRKMSLGYQMAPLTTHIVPTPKQAPHSMRTFLRGQDAGIWNYNTLGVDSRNSAAHEFAHLLGINDHEGDVLSNTNPIGRPLHAQDADFRWGIQEVTDRVNYSRDSLGFGRDTTNPNRTLNFSEHVGAPSFGWWK